MISCLNKSVKKYKFGSIKQIWNVDSLSYSCFNLASDFKTNLKFVIQIFSYWDRDE